MDFIQSDLFKLIVLGVFCIVSLILVIAKKKPATDLLGNIFAQVVQMLPTFIETVERPGEGRSKKLEVVEAGLAMMSKKLGRELTEDEKIVYATKMSTQIEMILSTPTKKEEVKK